MASFFAPAPRSRPGPDHDPPLVARRPTLRNPCRSSEPFRPPYGKSVATATRAEPTSSFRLALAKRLPTSRQRFSGSERPRRLTGLEPRRTCATTGPPHALRDTFVGRAAPGQERSNTNTKTNTNPKFSDSESRPVAATATGLLATRRSDGSIRRTGRRWPTSKGFAPLVPTDTPSAM